MRKNRTKRRRTRRRRKMRGGAWYNPMSWGQTTNSAGEAEGGWFSGLFGKKKKAPEAGIAEPDSPQSPVDVPVQQNPNEATDSNPSFDAGSDANEDIPAAAQVQDGGKRRRRKKRKTKKKRGGGCGCAANLTGGRRKKRRRTRKKKKSRKRKRRR